MSTRLSVPGGMFLHELQGHVSDELSGYITGILEVDGFNLELLFRVKDDQNGPPMELVSIDHSARHPSISGHWEDLSAALSKFAAAWKDSLRAQLNARASQILSEHCPKDENGTFSYEPFDVTPELSNRVCESILSHEGDKRMALETMLQEMYLDDAIEAHGYFSRKLEEMLDKDPILRKTAEVCDWHTSDFMTDHWNYCVPLEDYLNQEIDIDIVVDTGDLNYEFTCNFFANGYYGDPENPSIPDVSSLLWLSKQQGISKESLLQVMKGETLYSPEMKLLSNKLEQTLAALKEYGFDERPHFCKGQFSEYQKLCHDIQVTQQKLLQAEKSFANNSLPYEEAMEQFPHAKAQYPTKDRFLTAQKDVLPRQRAGIKELKSKVERLQESMKKEPAFSHISRLHEAYKNASALLYEYKKDSGFQKAQFAESIIRESANVASGINALTFLVKMPLSSAIALNDIIEEEKELNDFYDPDKRAGKSSIILGKDTPCGLYDFVNGGGSLLDIQLAQDVELPVKYIFSAKPDGTLGYGVQDIWGGMEYEPSLKEIQEVPPAKSLDHQIQFAKERSPDTLGRNDTVTHDHERT